MLSYPACVSFEGFPQTPLMAEIRAIRPPDAYKGKGIRYARELVRLKTGKAVGKKT
ncbi:unnamed protein product [marine sediment metagenome]|uniref:Ribosomal protein L6 alpha-beta domain-containing protein n=1 Tax=marine sediment metagenome TaxID=412755 RepID=X1BES3_9ZZZZ